MPTAVMPVPPGWAAPLLNAIVQINPPLNRHIPSDDVPVTFVPMRSIESEGGGLVRPESRPYGAVKKGYTSFMSGDVIMAKITPCMENGKIAVVHEVPGKVCFGSTEFHVLRPEPGIQPRWVAQFLLKHDVRRSAQRQMTGGVGQMRVPASFLETVRIPIPPVLEQARIADALDELFSDLDAGVAALLRAREKLKLYRASVLKAAVEGASSPSSRPRGRSRRRTGRRSTRNPSRPTRPTCCGCRRGGAGVANVYEDRLDLSDVKLMNFTPEEFATYALKRGDVLLNEGQSPERKALLPLDGAVLEEKYREILEKLGVKPGMLGVIFKGARCEINNPALLKQLIVNLLDKVDWLSLPVDVKGTIYEELLSRSAQESSRGAGQYFTPRAVIQSLCEVMQPTPQETADDLETVLEQFTKIAARLKAGPHSPQR